jgi:hypothetical protein
MTGRVLIMLVVMTAMVASRHPAALAAAPASEQPRVVQRANWIDRIQVGLSSTITRSALLQRIAFVPPKPPIRLAFALDTHPVQRELPDPFRFCLPPPARA